MIDYCAALWSQIEHPNIVPLWGVCNQFDRPNISCLVFPYLRNGNITGYLRDRPDIDKLPLVNDIDIFQASGNVAQFYLSLHRLPQPYHTYTTDL